MNRRILTGIVFAAWGLVGAAFADDPPATQPATPPGASPDTNPGIPATRPPVNHVVKPVIYDEKADAKQQIAAAVAKAKHENRRVLIQWGGNWCPWCIRLHELFNSDPKIARTLKYEYDVVLVDSGKPAGKNVDLATSYGADLKTAGYPYLTILDGDGKAVANQETGALEKKNEKGESIGVEAGHDPAKVLKFLTDNQAKYVAAEDVLKKALAEAKAADGKRVFLHFGAPWCIWCHRLEDWMATPEVAKLLTRDYIETKIDVDRMPGAKELMARYRTNNGGAIPWCAILDADGKTLITGDTEKGNMGFPTSDEPIAHFGEMLKKSAKSLTEAEIATILKSLTEESKKYQTGAGH